MINSDCLNAKELEIQMRKRIAELEKANQDLRAENIALNQDITKRKRAEGALRHSEQRFKLKLGDDLSYSQMAENLELADIIDIQAVQSLMDDFYKFARITMALLDLKGNILIGVGWQDICTKFHRVHPETCKHCVESDTRLSAGVSPGEFKLYKCKNNMWDIVTPIMAGDQHIGNIFSGQFFFEDEPVDYEFFRSQARKYSFNEEEYIAALEKVPRLSRDTVEKSMSFFMKLANMISQLGHSNIELAEALSERYALVDELQESEERFRSVLENSLDSAYRLDLQNNCFDYMSPVIEQITGFSAKEINAMTSNDLLDRIHPDDRPLVVAGIAKSLNEGFGIHEYRFKCKDGKYRWLADHFSIIKDKSGMARFRSGLTRDITERKRTEKALEKAYNVLEEKVKERTAELENAYNSLKESERSLAEAQKMAHIGNWSRNLITGEVQWSDEVYRIFGFEPQEIGVNYDLFLSHIHPEDQDCVIKEHKQVLEEKLSSIDYRIVLDNGEEHIVHEEVKVVFDEKNVPIDIRGTIQDITERKKAEKALVDLETARQKEIHHRIKNNLQVISSLLDLQAEKFSHKKCIEDSEVLKAFRESQNRVLSIALIHEELYEGKETDKLDFSLYLQRLVENLFQTYRLGNIDIRLKTDLEENIFFDMDAAIPLGMIVNELISNSFKYAFPNWETGEIQIKLFSEEAKDLTGKSTTYTLIVSDNGIGIPENVDFENPETLGLQLVNILVDQLDGEIELRKNNGTEFKIIISL